MDGLSAVIRSERILDYTRQYLNDFADNQPARKSLRHFAENLRILADQYETRGTVPAHQTRVVPHRSLASFLWLPRVVPHLIRGIENERDLCLVATGVGSEWPIVWIGFSIVHRIGRQTVWVRKGSISISAVARILLGVSQCLHRRRKPRAPKGREFCRAYSEWDSNDGSQCGIAIFGRCVFAAV